MSRTRRVSRLLWPLAVLAIGIVIGFVFIWTAPETRPEDKVRATRIVQTISPEPATEEIAVAVDGSVIPAQRVVMKPQVSGRVIDQHESLVPGGYIKAGAELVRIDAADYELALTEHESAMEEARFELEVEKGRQVVAAREWSLLEEDLGETEVNRALVLREPHLRRIAAMLRKATNEIAKARLDLARTSVLAPFNAMVLSESVELGQLVEPGTEICTLIGADEFWVQAALPLGDLKWIQLPGPDREGAAATVILDAGEGRTVSWTGTVVRLLSDLEPTGRMARVLIRVRDPLGLKEPGRKPPLLVGSYVRVEINAGRLDHVLSLPRAALREGGHVWVVDTNSQLQIRAVEVLWRRRDNVLVSNVLKPGEQVITSGLRMALPGMKVDAQPLSQPARDEPPVESNGP